MRQLLYIPGGSYVLYRYNGKYQTCFEEHAKAIKISEQTLFDRMFEGSYWNFCKEFFEYNKMMPVELLTKEMFEIVEIEDK